jgi:hypothetical protein
MKKLLILSVIIFSAYGISAQVTLYGGWAENATAGENITAPAVVYISSVDSKVYKASAASTANRAIGVVFADAVTDGATQVAFSGIMVWPTTLTVGLNYYLDASTAGAITTTAPANAQLVGRAVAIDKMQLLLPEFKPTTITGNAGTATALATPRAIYGNNFDGSAALTGIIASTYGGTGNGFAKLSGPASTEKTFTLPNASATILTDNAAVTVAQGGTGLTALGTALQQLRVNAGATALEYFTPSAGSGDITNGGNTTGAAVTIGTNDAFGLNLETNNVTRMAITGGASTGGAVTHTDITSKTNAVEDALVLQTNSSGTAANGLGGGMLFQLESSTTDNRDAARIQAAWAIAADATRSSSIIGKYQSSAIEVEAFRFAGNTGTLTINGGSTTFGNAGITTGSTFTLGNSTQTLNLGGSGATGQVNVLNTSTSANGINIYNNANAATSVGGISIGGATNFTAQTSGVRNYMNFDYGFSPTSGSAENNSLVFSGTYNQTGGASGATRRVYDKTTLTAVANYCSFQTDVNTANADAFRQSGASSYNRFSGKTSIGSQTTPTDQLEVTGNLALKAAGNKIKIPTGSNASQGVATLVAGTVTVNTTAVATGDYIWVQLETAGGTVGQISAPTAGIVNGTSFDINSYLSSGLPNTADTSTVHWWITGH